MIELERLGLCTTGDMSKLCGRFLDDVLHEVAGQPGKRGLVEVGGGQEMTDFDGETWAANIDGESLKVL